MVNIEMKVGIFQSIEIWFLDLMINLLSRSTLVRGCVRRMMGLVSERPISLFFALLSVTCFFGVISGYIFYLLAFNLR
jgi:hypothetical protein